MGVLTGIRVIELGGLGPGPFCGMLLADMGADVVVVDRREQGSLEDSRLDFFNRNKRSIRLDLKKPGAGDALLDMMGAADMLIDPYRPGVTDRLGIGPAACLARNPALVYGQITGWGAGGPLSEAAGHDLNYIALCGALDSIGNPEAPIPPLNLVGDYGGGAMYLLSGLLAAHIHALKTGVGQVIDAAMCDGATSLMTGTYAYWQQGRWQIDRGANFLDGGVPYYNVYRCRDGRFVSIAPIEPRFYADLLARLGLDGAALPAQHDTAAASELRAALASVFATRTRDEWCALLEGSDACFAPVLSIEEAPNHPHNIARGAFIWQDGIVQPAPAPRFSVTPSQVQRPPPDPGADTDTCLAEWGVSATAIAALRDAGAIAAPHSDTREASI